MAFFHNFWQRLLGFDPHRERAFPGQQPGEEVELLTVFHGIRIIPLFIYLLLFSFVIVLLNIFINFTAPTSFYVNTIFIALLLQILCWRLYNHFLKVIIITNRRLIYIQHSVLLERERETIPLTYIQDFRFKQKGILPRIFGYGDLIILGSSSEVKYRFKYVPKVNKVHHILGEVHHKIIRERPPMQPIVEEGGSLNPDSHDHLPAGRND